MIHARRFASTVGAVLALVVAASCVLGFLSARRAEADTAYRYWAFYIANGSTWNYSSRGPVAEHPVDGEVQGWRFAVQLDRTGELTPRATPDFDQLCGSTPAISGELRVGIVLDFGTAADAPTGEHPPAQVVSGCVHVDSGSSGADVLQAAVGASNLRIGSSGLLCGIDGYPKTECAPAVDTSRTTPTPTPTVSSTATAPTQTKEPKAPKEPSTPDESPGTPAKSPVASPPASSAQASSTAASTAVPPTAGAAGSAASALGGSATPLSSVHPKSSNSQGFPVAAVAGGVLVVGLGIAAFIKARR